MEIYLYNTKVKIFKYLQVSDIINSIIHNNSIETSVYTSLYSDNKVKKHYSIIIYLNTMITNITIKQLTHISNLSFNEFFLIGTVGIDLICGLGFVVIDDDNDADDTAVMVRLLEILLISSLLYNCTCFETE